MKSEIKNKTDTEAEFEIQLDAEEFNSFIDKAAISLGKDLEIKGFRKGKVPQNVVEEHIGSEKILVEAADLAVNESYKKAVRQLTEENKIEAILYPRVEIKKMAKGSDFIFTAKTSIMPQIDLPDYKKIASKIKRNKVVVEEKELAEALKWLQKSRAKLTLKNDVAQKGDFVQIEYTLADKPGSTPIKDGFILGEGRLLPGFEDNLVGMKVNEEKKGVNLDSNGKKFVVNVKLISVQNMELPEMNDELAKSLGKFENLETLKKNIREGVTLEKENAESQRVRQEIIQEIGKKLKFAIPNALIDQEKTQMLENIKKQVDQGLKIPFADYLKQVKKTELEILESLSEQAEKRIKNFLILREIGKRENIDISKTDEIFKLLENLTQKS